MTTRFNNNFSAFTTKSIDATDSRISGPFPGNVWEVFPKFIFSVDVTAARTDEARDAWQAFIIDCRDGLRTLINNLTGTTVNSVHYHTADGDTVEVTF